MICNHGFGTNSSALASPVAMGGGDSRNPTSRTGKHMTTTAGLESNSEHRQVLNRLRNDNSPLLFPGRPTHQKIATCPALLLLNPSGFGLMTKAFAHDSDLENIPLCRISGWSVGSSRLSGPPSMNNLYVLEELYLASPRAKSIHGPSGTLCGDRV